MAEIHRLSKRFAGDLAELQAAGRRVARSLAELLEYIDRSSEGGPGSTGLYEAGAAIMDEHDQWYRKLTGLFGQHDKAQ